jgi:G3E family GTPase
MGKKYRDIYKNAGNIIPTGYHIHHIIPTFEKGKDVLDNLICISKEDHKQIHLDRYNEFGDSRDYCAYVILDKGIQALDPEMRKVACSNGGLQGSKIQKEKQIGAYFDPILKREISSKGGKRGAWTQSEWQREFGRRGGPKNKGFIWYNDGISSFKYTKKMQEVKPFEEFLKDNPQFISGRTIKTKGRIWVNDGHKNYFIFKEDFNESVHFLGRLSTEDKQKYNGHKNKRIENED